MKKLFKPFATAILLTLVTATVVLAASSVILRGYQIDFIEVVKDDINNTTTWTYAITADGDEPFGLSHWTLDLDLSCGYRIIAPSGSYTTPTSYVPQSGEYAGIDICAAPDVYNGNCQASSYTVVPGLDATTSLSGIKFEDPNPELSAPGTHIFSFQLANGDLRKGAVAIALKAGNGYEIGTIDGPVCSPTALTLANLHASTNSANLLLTVALVSTFALACVLATIGLKFRLATNN